MRSIILTFVTANVLVHVFRFWGLNWTLNHSKLKYFFPKKQTKSKQTKNIIKNFKLSSSLSPWLYFSWEVRFTKYFLKFCFMSRLFIIFVDSDKTHSNNNKILIKSEESYIWLSSESLVIYILINFIKENQIFFRKFWPKNSKFWN